MWPLITVGVTLLIGALLVPLTFHPPISHPRFSIAMTFAMLSVALLVGGLLVILTWR